MFNPFGDTPPQPAKPEPQAPPQPPAAESENADDDARWAAAWSKHTSGPENVHQSAEPAGEPKVDEPAPAPASPDPPAEASKSDGWSMFLSQGEPSEEPDPMPEPVEPPKSEGRSTFLSQGEDAPTSPPDESDLTPEPVEASKSDGWSTFLSQENDAPAPESYPVVPAAHEAPAPASDWRSMVAAGASGDDEPRKGAWGRRQDHEGNDDEAESPAERDWGRVRDSEPVEEPSDHAYPAKRGWGRSHDDASSDDEEKERSASKGAWGRRRDSDPSTADAHNEDSARPAKRGWGRDDASGKADDADGTDVGWIDDLGDPDDGLDDAPGSSFSNASAARMVGMVVAALLVLALVVGGGLYVGRLVSARRAAAARDEACRSWSVALGDYRQAVRDAKALGLKTVKAASVCPTDTDGAADLKARTKRVEKQVRTKVAGEWRGTADKLAKVKTSYPSVSDDTADRAAVLAKRAPSSKRELDSLKAQAKTVLDDAASEQKKADDAAAKRKAEDERAAQEKAAAEEARRQAEAQQQRSTPSYTPTYTPSYTPSYTPTYTAPKTRTTTPRQSAPKQTTPPPSGSNTFSD